MLAKAITPRIHYLTPISILLKVYWNNAQGCSKLKRKELSFYNPSTPRLF